MLLISSQTTLLVYGPHFDFQVPRCILRAGQVPFCYIGSLNYALCCCSVTQSCLTLCDPTDCSRPGLPVPHHLPKFGQVHVHCIGDAIQPPHPLRSSRRLLLLPSIFPRIRELSNELVVCIKYASKNLGYLRILEQGRHSEKKKKSLKIIQNLRGSEVRDHVSSHLFNFTKAENFPYFCSFSASPQHFKNESLLKA